MAIDTLLSAAHLRRAIGEEPFMALVSSDNTAEVRKFAEELLKSALPTTLTIGDRTYDILSFANCRENFESECYSNSLSERTRRMKAHLGQEEGEYLLKHQGEIPAILKDIVFVFTAWCRSKSKKDFFEPEVACISRRGQYWVLFWVSRDGGWADNYRVLRRKSA